MLHCLALYENVYMLTCIIYVSMTSWLELIVECGLNYVIYAMRLVTRYIRYV